MTIRRFDVTNVTKEVVDGRVCIFDTWPSPKVTIESCGCLWEKNMSTGGRTRSPVSEGARQHKMHLIGSFVCDFNRAELAASYWPDKNVTC